jgi:6-phospho-beta-glucosidase
MKICVVGGGSTYTPELVDGILRRRARLPVDEIYLLDPNVERVSIVGRFMSRMAAAAGANVSVKWGQSPRDAIRGSSFVVTQLRVGGQAARDRDEQMGRDFGLVGQETTGVGGFAKGLRTIPVILEVARVVAEEAPDAWIVNFTNPAGMITETLRRFTNLKVVGLCNVPWNMKQEVATGLSIDMDELELDYVGLNHLSWVRGFKVQGQDRTKDVLSTFRAKLGKQAGGSHKDEPEFDESFIQALGAIPNYYLIYFYETAQVLRYQETHPTRAKEVMDVEDRLIKRYEDESLTTKPEELKERGGAYYSESAAALMADIWSDAGSVQIVNTRNDGALENLPNDTVIEVPARITKNSISALKTAPLRPDIDALVRAVKDYELLTIDAAMSGDRDRALLALATNPLGPRGKDVVGLWDRLRRDNAGMLGKLDG